MRITQRPEIGSPRIINSTLSFFFFLVQYKQARNGGQVEVGFLIYLHGEQCWHLTTSAIIHYGAKLCKCNMHSTQRRAANRTKNVSRLDSCVFFASSKKKKLLPMKLRTTRRTLKEFRYRSYTLHSIYPCRSPCIKTPPYGGSKGSSGKQQIHRATPQTAEPFFFCSAPCLGLCIECI